MRRRILPSGKAWTTLLLVIFSLHFTPPPIMATERPNILFFLSDDHRWDRLGSAGHPFLKTPTLDRLAARGARFSNMFVTTSICAASRASILTGIHERTHRFTFGTPPVDERWLNSSYPVRLRDAGFRTGFVGKFGVQIDATQLDRMFDSFFPISRTPYFKEQPDGSLRHASEVAGDRAIEFLKTQSSDQPFCLSVSFNASHAEDGDRRPGIGHYPWPRSVDSMYEDLDIAAPRLSAPWIFDAHPNFMKTSMNRDRFFWRWDTEEKYRTNIRAYYRMISGIDGVIHRVLKMLEQQGLEKNTIIIFSGDNGYYEGQRGFAGKWSHYEESLRVPLIIYDPRLKSSKRGKLYDPMVVNLDIPATILDYASVDIPEHYQGRSLVSIVAGKKPRHWRQDTFCEHLMNHASIPKWEGVRGSRYVYARYFQQTPVFEYLHDLDKDPNQLSNLVLHDGYARILKQMRRRCDTLRDEYGGIYSLETFPSKSLPTSR